MDIPQYIMVMLKERGLKMKSFILVIGCLFMLNACGTVGGAIDGAGDDLKQAGKWVKQVGK